MPPRPLRRSNPLKLAVLVDFRLPGMARPLAISAEPRLRSARAGSDVGSTSLYQARALGSLAGCRLIGSAGHFLHERDPIQSTL
jgi:hypothetical protein